MKQDVSKVIIEVKSAAQSLNAGAEEVASSAQQIADGATQQSASFEELSTGVQATAGLSGDANELSRKLSEDVRGVGKGMTELIEAMTS